MNVENTYGELEERRQDYLSPLGMGGHDGPFDSLRAAGALVAGMGFTQRIPAGR